ncbi:MAG: hypothetical protein E6J02_11510 [Chloroflexi bacterium]|nr:MAG: hypothetical protein E6J02_11510 [Chloroflexota bacterium]TME16866.1 MAG: hypothetical protein E6I63_05040 [Chloroflexota bacterium]TME18176.1 MAG: hypothetical protein E6I70_08720 [Chloroflexota bacterium]
MSSIRSLVSELAAPLRRWQTLEKQLTRIAGHFTTWPADEFARFTNTSIGHLPVRATTAAQPPPVTPFRPPAPESIAPGAFEMRFTRLQREGRYEQMWSMLAEDAQRSWGGEDRFVEEMRRQAGAAELLEAEVFAVEIVPEWTDRHRNRTYRNVARLAVRYRLKLERRELSLDRQVHLIPAADGWRTLCYPQAN